MRHSKPADGLIVLTDDTCVLDKTSWPGIPTLIWEDGIDVDVSDWLRELVVKHRVAKSSALDYAKTVRPFFRFCRRQQISWQDVDDRFLVFWRQSLLRQKVEANRINRYLRQVFSFYRWAEEDGRTKWQVGIYFEHELPEELRDFEFPISAKVTFTKGSSGTVISSWHSPLVMAGERQPHRHTPNAEEVKRVHRVALGKMNAERDCLMMSWAEEIGARRAEFMNLRCDQMPTAEHVAEIVEHNIPFEVSLFRKRGISQVVNVPIDLVIRTMDYIQFERKEIVERCVRRNGYVEPKEIFISSTTGGVLHLDTVTKLGVGYFREAKVPKASIHRLRARFIERVIDVLLDAWFDGQYRFGNESVWVDTILTKASVMMGHMSPRSLRPYLTNVLRRRVQAADANGELEKGAKLRQLDAMLAATALRLGQAKELQRAAHLISEGRAGAAADALEAVARALRQTQLEVSPGDETVDAQFADQQLVVRRSIGSTFPAASTTVMSNLTENENQLVPKTRSLRTSRHWTRHSP